MMQILPNLLRIWFYDYLSLNFFILALLLIRTIFKSWLSAKSTYRLWLLLVLRLALPWRFLPTQFNWLNLFNFSSLSRVWFDSVRLPDVSVTLRQPINLQAFNSDLLMRIIWISGVCITALILIVNNIRIKNLLKKKRKLWLTDISECPTYTHQQVHSALITGWGKRKALYLNPELSRPENVQTLQLVLAHEYGHASSHDGLWGIVRLIILCFYWFNPFVWLAATLAASDAELAADQAAIETVGTDNRRNYARVLLAFSNQSTHFKICPQTVAHSLSSNARSLESRIRKIYRQPRPSGARRLVVLLLVLALMSAGFGRIDRLGQVRFNLKKSTVEDKVERKPQQSYVTFIKEDPEP